MARRPMSRAKGPVQDVRALEERLCLPRNSLGPTIKHLYQKLETTTSNDALLREDRIWLEIRDAVAFLFLLLTGLRRFEFCACACGDIDLEAGKLWVIGKNNVRDFVPLSDQAVSLAKRFFALKDRRGESLNKEAPLFCSTGINEGFLSFSALRLRWKRLLQELKLPDHYGIHATRHAAGMLVFAQTASIEKTARFLRHRDTATTARHYLHVDADALRAELSSIELWRK